MKHAGQRKEVVLRGYSDFTLKSRESRLDSEVESGGEADGRDISGSVNSSVAPADVSAPNHRVVDRAAQRDDARLLATVVPVNCLRWRGE